ncbi:hypothetical protein HKBW3S47_02238, partial [Candidatus Hakubella thermalkaliphila]
MAVQKSKTQLYYFPFSRVQSIQNTLQLLLEKSEGSSIYGHHSFLILDEITQMAVFFLSNGVSRETGSWDIFIISRTLSA